MLALGFKRRKGKLARLNYEADRARDQKEWKSASLLYEEILSANGSNGDIWIQLGHVRKEAGDHLRAKEAYLKAEALMPFNPDVLIQLGHLHKLLDNHEVCALYYMKALDAGSKDEHAIHFLKSSSLPAKVDQVALSGLLESADKARDERRFNLAAALYDEAIAGGLKDPRIKIQAGNAFKEIGNLVKAEAFYRSALDDDELSSDCHLQLGHLFKIRGRQRSAQSHYRRSYELDPTSTSAAVEIGATRISQGIHDLTRSALSDSANRVRIQIEMFYSTRR